MADHCHVCIRDTFSRSGNKSCPILMDAMVYKIDHPEYPKQWVYDKDGIPTCTSFRHYQNRVRSKPEEKKEDPSQILMEV